jgi:dihydroorotate dehydrogenase (fumarate)
VHTYKDALKGLMAGASVTMMASELLRNGMGRIGEILNDMIRWMELYEYESVQQMIGSMSQRNVSRPDLYEGANYMKELQSFHKRV